MPERRKFQNVAIIAYTQNGKMLARKAAAFFPDACVKLCTAPRLADGLFHPENAPEYSAGQLFTWADALIYIGALGIAVRRIAPFVKDKKVDPAVLCLDEKGRFVIPVLSGHIGGANELALDLAGFLGAVPVITTATDVNHRFSVDTWARQNHMAISDMKLAKAVSAAILERDIPLESDLPLAGDYPPGCRAGMEQELSDTGILISWEIREPFAATLRLIPAVLHLGIGCRRGTAKEQIREAVRRVFSEHGLDPRAVQGVYSIDLKAEEAGLVAYCAEQGWPFTVYTAEELMQVPGEFTSSEFVRKTTGADNICERAAMAGAQQLLISKTSLDGVTVAVALEHYQIEF